jgi:aminoglycoside-2''-adenylyltransferase
MSDIADHNGAMTSETAVPAPAPPDLGFEAFQRIYGPISALTPVEAGVLFAGAPFRWWVAGGWSVELDAEPRRFHEDLEVAVPRDDVPAVRDWLHDYHLWDTHEAALRYLPPDVSLPVDHGQLWLRRDGYSPWLLDLMLTPVTGETWFYKRDERISRSLDQVIRVGADGIPYQRPEITLLFKARRRWEKDELDFAAIVPNIDPSDRAWLRDAIALTEPARHPWLVRLG